MSSGAQEWIKMRNERIQAELSARDRRRKQEDRRQRLIDIRADRKAALEQALLVPFFDGSLLTEAEREEIRVRYRVRPRTPTPTHGR